MFSLREFIKGLQINIPNIKITDLPKLFSETFLNKFIVPPSVNPKK